MNFVCGALACSDNAVGAYVVCSYADNVGVGAPRAFTVASKWTRQTAVAINRVIADFTDVDKETC